jgi:hypothetical protein
MNAAGDPKAVRQWYERSIAESGPVWKGRLTAHCRYPDGAARPGTAAGSRSLLMAGSMSTRSYFYGDYLIGRLAGPDRHDGARQYD